MIRVHARRLGWTAVVAGAALALAGCSAAESTTSAEPSATTTAAPATDPEAYVAYVVSLGTVQGTEDELIAGGQKACDGPWAQGQTWDAQRQELEDSGQYPADVIDSFLRTRAAALYFLCPQYLSADSIPADVIAEMTPAGE